MRQTWKVLGNIHTTWITITLTTLSILPRYITYMISFRPTDIREIPEPAPFFILAWGSNWGYSNFSRIKITVINFVRYVYVLRSEHKDKRYEPTQGMARKDHGRILFAFVSACAVGKIPNTPNLSSMANDAITWEWYTRSEISLEYLCSHLIYNDNGAPYTRG